MNRTKLIQHFDTLAETPDAVAKLRNFVLSLAVRGQLLPQNAEDEKPARWKEFVAKFPQKKTQDEEPPFALPKSWRWVRLNDVADYSAADKVDPSEIKDGDWVLDLEEIEKDTSRIIRIASFAEKQSTSTKAKFLPGDVLYGKLRPYLNKVVVAPQTGFCTTEIVPIRSRGLIEPTYLCVFLRSPDFVNYANSKSYGMKMPRLGTDDAVSAWVAVPPPAEQRRIVAKVEELLALCDELEARQTAAREHRTRLVRSALDHLTSGVRPSPGAATSTRTRVSENSNARRPHHAAAPGDGCTPDDFQQHAAFVLQHSDLVLDSVSDLRQVILSLAVQGHIAADSKTWPKEPEPLGKFAPMQNGYAFQSEWFVPKGVRLLRNKNVSHGVMQWDDMECIVENRLKEFERFRLDEGDVVLSLDRPFISTGIKVARVRREDLPCLLLQRVGRFQPDAKRLHPDYLFLFLNSPQFAGQIDPGRSNGVPHISSKQVEAAVIFVPLRAEQQRIVAKVDELMRWCDALEGRLT